MANWTYLENESFTVTCKSETQDIGSKEFYGCCEGCKFLKSYQGESWLDDRIWCGSPAPIKKGESIRVVKLIKYRKAKNATN